MQSKAIINFITKTSGKEREMAKPIPLVNINTARILKKDL